MWRQHDNLWELVFSSYLYVVGIELKLSGLVASALNLPSHLFNLKVLFFESTIIFYISCFLSLFLSIVAGISSLHLVSFLEYKLCLWLLIFLFQLIDITGKNQDECVIALHDCNGDVNRAINVLLEGNPDTVEC